MTATHPDVPIHIAGLDRSGKTTAPVFLNPHPRVDIPAVGSRQDHLPSDRALTPS